MSFVVTGLGHSGTGFVARLLTEAGVPCGHEKFFNPVTSALTGEEGDSSWLAAPYLAGLGVPVVHLVRRPSLVVHSWATAFEAVVPSQDPHLQYAARHSGLGDYLSQPWPDRVVQLYQTWNERIAGHASARVQVESLTTPEAVRVLGALLGKEIEHAVAARALGAVATTYNGHVQTAERWLPARLAQSLRALDREYGYGEGAAVGFRD